MKLTGFVLILILTFGLHNSVIYGQNNAINDRQIISFFRTENLHALRYLQFLSVGDVGTGRLGQILVANTMAEQAVKNPIEFVLMLGDNFYPAGVESVYDRQWKSKFQKIYDHSSLDIPFYVVLGNHGYYGNPDAQVAYTNFPGNSRWTMPSKYYTFDRPIDESTAVQFFALDTTSIAYGKDESLKQIKWLEEKLKSSNAEWKIVFGHHPLYSGGMYGDNETMKKRLEGLFIKYKVDLYLAGHDHDQQLLGPVRGVYYIVNGSGSKVRSTGRQQNTIYANSNVGFARFRISRDELRMSFIDFKGKIKYTYTIKTNRTKST